MSLRSLLALLCLFFFQACFHPVWAQVNSAHPFAWKITKTQWSVQDEKSFQEMVTRLGEAVESRKCKTVTECLKSPANTYFKSDPAGLRYVADCADFPYYMRAYFAWKNGLPFSFATSMRFRNVPGNQDRDIRYSRYGNEVASRFSSESSNGQFKDARNVLNNLIMNYTSSANFRIYYGDDKADLFTDYYPVSIDRDSIRPGTVIYDPNGHVAMVYRVSEDGKIYYIDAHPDNSLTAGTYGVKYVRSHPGQGAGFKNFRPVKLVGAVADAQGVYMGGQVKPALNKELGNYSIEQFFGNTKAALPDNRWSEGVFLLDGKKLSYFDYVRQKMSLGNLRVDPLAEFESILSDLCDSLKDRVNAVDVALASGIQNQSHPARLPENIYGTSGDWETYSTPSRDAQLKVSFVELLNQSREFIQKWQNNDEMISYSGQDLAADLLQVYQRQSQSCEINYTNSAGRSVTLNIEDIRQRVFLLSFDPYHCAEYRWGASSPEELQTCRDDANKRLWYAREQRLRNQHIRQYDERMDFTVDQLAQPLPGNGVAVPPDVDLLRFLQSHMN